MDYVHDAYELLRAVPVYPDELSAPDILRRAGVERPASFASDVFSRFNLCEDDGKICFPDKEEKKRSLNRAYMRVRRREERNIKQRKKES